MIGPLLRRSVPPIPMPEASWSAATISGGALTDLAEHGHHAALASGSNAPIQLVASDGYIYTPGSTGNVFDGVLTTLLPSSPATLEWMIRFKLLSPLGTVIRLCGWDTNKAGLYLQTNGNPTVFIQSTTSAFLGNAQATSNLPTPTGDYVWWRARLTLSSGLCEYWYSQDDTDEEAFLTWTFHSSAVGVPLGSYTADLTKSSRNEYGGIGTTIALGAEAKWRRGIHKADGVIRSEFSGSDGGSPWFQYFDAAGVSWVYRRSATGRKTCAVQSGSVLLAGTDDYASCPDAALLDVAS